MKIRKLGDDLYRSLCEVYPYDTARKLVYDFIEKNSIDLIFMTKFYKEEFLDYFSKAEARELQKEITDDFDVRFEMSSIKSMRERMDRPARADGKDEFDYANMAPDRWKNYYYQN